MGRMDEQQTEERSDRDVYMTKLYVEKQNNIVNVRCASSMTSTVLTWSHRTTNCDVISTITTTVPLKNGAMKDIKMYKFKAPSKKSTINMYQNPLENGFNDDRKARKLCCAILHKERKAFMQELHTSRNKRTALETIAAVIIQTRFRGYSIRRQAKQIQKRCQMRHAIHGSLVTYVQKHKLPPMTTRAEHRNNHMVKRAHSAIVIQCAFRCYLTKNFIYRRRYEYEMNKMHQASLRIQLLARRNIAKDIVARKRERSTLEKRALGVLKIQSQVRMMISRRKVAIRKFKLHWLAARMIQGCFRGRNTRKCMAVYLAAQEKVKFFRGARGMQQVIRGRIGRSRVNRIKLRYLYLKIFKAVTKIQSMARKFAAIRCVAKCKEEKQFRDQIRMDVILAAEKQKDAQEAEALMNSMDIFFQTKQGETSTVDALYHSEIEGGVSSETIVNVKNDIGDTILSQAAKCNHLDIIRKCINWGYDVNHENALGENIITLAASGGHMSVVTYLLSDSQRNLAALIAAQPKKEKKIKPKKTTPPPEKSSPDPDPSPGVKLSEEKKQDVTETAVENGDGEDMTFMTGQYDRGAEEDIAKEKQNEGGEQSKDTQEPKQEKSEVKEEEEGEEEEEEEEEVPVIIQSSKVLRLSSEDMGTILVAAAKHPDITHLKMIIENNYVTNINEVQPLTDLTALHVACEEGHIEHVEFLLQNGAKLDVRDDNGQLPLHKSAKSSLELFKKMISLTNTAEGVEGKYLKQEQLLLKDTDGKDCFIIASLHGKTDIVEFIEASVDMNSRVISDEVGWSVNDILNTAQLVEKGNLSCLKNVILEGFDAAWCPEETGLTIAMIACKFGRTDIIDYLITDVGADFSTCDVNGLNSFHYAAQYTRKDIIPLLLSVGDKAKDSCKLTKSLLTVQDSKGYSPLHYSAECGSTLSFELLAQNEITAALALSDTNGCTPLLIACKFKQSNKVAEILKLGATATDVDNQGNNALWHYFIQITKGPDFALAVNPTVELDIIQALLKSGCSLFNRIKSTSERDIEHIVREYSALFGSNKRTKHPVNQHEATFEYLLAHIQPTDLAALESNLSFFNILPAFISPQECWGAALSAMFFHSEILGSYESSYGKGNSKCLASLFDGQAAALLVQLKDSEKTEGAEKVLDESLKDTNTKSEAKTESESDTIKNSPLDSNDAVRTLESTLYNDVSILGWAIKSKNKDALTFLLRKGHNPNAIVDTRGNNCLHFAVMYGTSAIVYALLDTTDAAMPIEVMILEAENKDGHTAAMLGAKTGTFENTKAVIQLGASSRRALGGKYWAWLLAITLQNERREINTQTGIYGDDDELYYPLHPNEMNAE